MKTVVTGSIAYDYLMSFPGRFADALVADQLEHVSLSFLVDTLRRLQGGTAPNIAYTLSLLGDRPKIMATAGSDFGEYQEWLERHGVDTSAVLVLPDVYCASFFANTDEDQNHIASFYAGAMAYAGQLSFATNAADAELAVIAPNDPQAMQAYAAECRALKIPYVYDPSQQAVRLSGEELRAGLDGCLLLTTNLYEHSLIREKTGLSSSEIAELAGGVLVTHGAKGALLEIDGQRIEIPAVEPKRLIEPTGAGDGFRAGLIRGMQLNLPWPIAGRMGALAATYVLEHEGPQGHFYLNTEFVTRYRQHFDDEGALDTLLKADSEGGAG